MFLKNYKYCFSNISHNLLYYYMINILYININNIYIIYYNKFFEVFL